MKNLYYLVWVDIIASAKRHHPDRTDWKYSLFILFTMCNALNLYSVDIFFNLIGIHTYLIKINIFPGSLLDSFAAFVLQFASIFILLNYFLIFYKDRYKFLLERYPSKNGKLALVYALCSIWIGFGSMILYSVLR